VKSTFTHSMTALFSSYERASFAFVVLCFFATGSVAADKVSTSEPAAQPSLLILDFELNDLTLHPQTVKEEERVKTLRPSLTDELSTKYGYMIAQLSAAERNAAQQGKGYLFDRPSVSARLGATVAAKWVISGRLHKASFLFVFLKSQIIEVATGEVRADFVVEIKGWEPRLTRKGVDALALQIHESLETLQSQ